GGAGQAYTTVLLNNTAPISVSPLSIEFASRTVGTTSPASTVLVTNDQATTLSITSVTMGGTDPGDFPYKSACKTTLLPGADCTISITFKPSVAGSRTASLMISDSVGTQTISISGVGK
ncbi:MAG: choice-of-anchor D domain-containing protein, partial [Terriglobales bacterium]